MPNPVVIHIVRPYASEDEYIAAEAWSIDSKAMLLIGGPELAPETLVLFDVALATGQKPIRAEAKVIAAVPAQEDRPAGLKVRFRRFGAATKAFIDRAVDARAMALTSVSAEAVTPPVSAEAVTPPVSAEAVTPPVSAETSAIPAAQQADSTLSSISSESEQPPPPVVPVLEAPAVSVATSNSDAAPDTEVAAPAEENTVTERTTRSEASTSGVHRRPIRTVPPPPNREALLERLRARGRELVASGRLKAHPRDKTG